MSELVERTGVPAATIRYYLVEHLLPPPHKIAANRFLYDERHVELVRLIRVLRERRGLSLESIGRLLPDLLPDLLGTPEGGIFNPAMWTEVLAAADPVASAATLREHLVDLATALFSERGYAEVTVDDVCRVANIAKGSFYRQVSSKEELFLAVVDQVAHRCSADFVNWAAGRTVTADAAVIALADALSGYLPVVLDLTSLAAQRRGGYTRGLRSFTATVCNAVLPVLDAGLPDEIVARAVYEGVRRIVTGSELS